MQLNPKSKPKTKVSRIRWLISIQMSSRNLQRISKNKKIKIKQVKFKIKVSKKTFPRSKILGIK